MGRWTRSWTEALSPSLFSDGWALFLPYAVVYLCGLLLNLKVGLVGAGFWLCHVGLVGLLVPYVLGLLRRRYASPREVVTDGAVWFWTLLCLGFLLPGAYLEYPSDPWDHFQRLNAWRPDTLLRAATTKERWAYFWGWTFLHQVEPVGQRLALAFLSAFWQGLLAFQMARLARRLGFSPAWSRAIVFGAIALFGNNLFSFFRYYALASTPLAYVSYLRAAIALLDIAEGRGNVARSSFALVLATAIMASNHPQEILLLGVFAAALTFARLSERQGDGGLRMLLGAASCLGGALALGWFVLSRAGAFGLRPPTDFYPFMSRFGAFRIWDPSINYFHTLGLHGLVSVGLAVLLWRRERLLAMLTLAPLFLLLFPPFSYFFAQATPSVRNTYRLLFALPDSFIIAATWRALPSRWLRAWSGHEDRVRVWGAVACLALMGLSPVSPFFGKLAFQYHVPSSMLSLLPLDQTAQWFRDNRRLSDECSITGDDVTEMALTSYRGVGTFVLRVSGQHWMPDGNIVNWRVFKVDELLDYASRRQTCGYLVLDPVRFRATFGQPPSSWVGALSGHWRSNAANLMDRQVDGLQEAVDGLPALGWRETLVPPFYRYYEPPASR